MWLLMLFSTVTASAGMVARAVHPNSPGIDYKKIVNAIPFHQCKIHMLSKSLQTMLHHSWWRSQEVLGRCSYCVQGKETTEG